MDYGRLLIYQYLPKELIPDDFLNAGFDEFFRLMGMAHAARKMRMEDIEIGVNKGYVAAHPDTE